MKPGLRTSTYSVCAFAAAASCALYTGCAGIVLTLEGPPDAMPPDDAAPPGDAMAAHDDGTVSRVVTDASVGDVGHPGDASHDGDAGPADGGTVAPDAAHGTWVSVGSMHRVRYNHTATLLMDGRVLVAGGGNGYVAWKPISATELYDPTSATWSTTGAMNRPRRGHNAVLLRDGRVLAIGGQVSGDEAVPAVPSAELYDPGAGTWTFTGSLHQARVAFMVALVDGGPLDGKVVVTGGTTSRQTKMYASTEIYDPATGVWTTDTANLVESRYWEVNVATPVLAGGSLLVAGGYTCCGYGAVNEAEIYDPVADSWSATAPKKTGANSPSVLMSNGGVLVAGGWSSFSVGTGEAETFDPMTGSWTQAPSMSVVREDHTLTPLPSGKVLAAGGAHNVGSAWVPTATAEEFDPSSGPSGSWAVVGSLTTARAYHSATLLADGTVLVAGGTDFSSAVFDSAELFVP